MSPSRLRPVEEGRASRDRGAAIVLVALLTTALFLVTALVIDLSLVRQNRQSGKSAADFAAAAGIRSLDNGSGQVQPWKGICAARDYLVANSAEFTGMTETYATGSGTPVTDPCDLLPATLCNPADTATWGQLTGSADGGRIRVTIQNGYALPDTNFAEDASTYGGADTGASPCANLAVIIEEGEAAAFGGVVGASGYETTIRSVARLTPTGGGDVAPALLLLERTDCRVLLIGGSSGAVVRAAGLGDVPGVIHSDSLGNGADCDPGDAQNGNIFQVDSNPPDPRIIVERAVTGAPGLMSAVALSGASGAEPQVVSSPSPDEVCVQHESTHCGTVAPITGGPIVGRDLIGRSRVDVRYRIPVRDLRDDATTTFAWDTDAATTAGFVRVDCGAAIPAEPKVWVDCGGGAFDGAGKAFGPTVEEVVINGYVTVGGSGNTLQFTDVDRLYIKGRSNGPAVALEGSAGNRLVVNAGSNPNSPCPVAGSAGSTTKMVIGHGDLRVAGGNSESDPKVLRLCQTTLLMADDSGDCPIPAVDGIAPDDNTCIGRIGVAGEATVDWTAPNVNTTSAPTGAQLQELEDLAFWTETQGAGVEWGILGNGDVRLGGVFFTPNADPFNVGGNGSYDIEDAQFITRRLEVRGNSELLMRPDPRNSVTVPALGGFTLAR